MFVYSEGIDKVATQIVQCVLLLTVLGLSGGVIARSSSFYQEILTVSENGRFPSLDGMRGILALSVFVHHTAFYEEYFRTGIWNINVHSFNFMLGKVGVAVFFMITGFLFWSKAIRATGRMNVLDLYVSRIWRLYPMIVFLLIVSLAVTAWQTQGFREPISRVATEIGQWLIGGFFGYPVINGAEPSYYNRVTWTLQYEVWFYLVLPIVAFVFWRFWMFVLMTFGVLLIALFAHLPDLAAFTLGGGAAYALARWPVPSTMPRSLSVVAALILIGLFTVGVYLPPGSWRFIAFPIFLAVLYGCNFFGFLETVAWRFLGTISYSVYLLHGTVLYIGLGLLNRFVPVATLSTVQMFAAFSVCAVIVVIVSASTYRFIEHPLMELGHRERTALRIKQTGVDTRVMQP